jgi:hypothetical protein
VRALNFLLPDHLALVVECFAKITDAMNQGTRIYFPADKTKTILKAGLNAEDSEIREMLNAPGKSSCGLDVLIIWTLSEGTILRMNRSALLGAFGRIKYD